MEGRSITRSVLIAGSGPSDGASQSWEAEWKRQQYRVCRLDIDARNEPDILASMTNLGDIGEFDVVYCCHALEHLYPHEVRKALSEFLRVLKPTGNAVIMVPDLEDVRPTEDPLDMDIPMTGLHLYYGDASQIESFPHMAHHCGFVKDTLERAMLGAGFRNVEARRAAAYNLIATGVK